MSNTDLNNERAIFQLIAEGDETAFAGIFSKYYQPLFWHAFKLLKSEFWAEEMVQEIFARIWLNRKSLITIEHPSSYLFRMVANSALDRIRKHQLEIKMQYFMSGQMQGAETMDNSDRKDQLDVWLLEAIDKLPEQRKHIYILKYQQLLSYDEIAQQLSISKNTVRNQMVKALDSIRSYLLEKKVLWFFFYFFISVS